MAAIENEIDRALALDPDQAEAGGDDATVRDILIACSSPGGFKQAANGITTPAAIIFDALPLGMPGAVVTWVTDGVDLATTGNQAQLAAGDMNDDHAVVTATLVFEGATYQRDITIQKLRDGVVGSSSFVWIKYADGPNGEGLSDVPDGKIYIGFAQDRPTATESTNPADYRWSLIKGSDGSSLRMWIKYSDNADGTGLYDEPTNATLYIGIAINKASAVESTDKADYTWSRFKGGDGVSVPGSRGAGFYRTSGNAWDDATADAITPGGNVVGDIVTISNGVVSYTKEWSGNSWFFPGAFLPGNLFVEKSIGVAQINTNGLDIRTPSGELILGSGSSLAVQTQTNPNLIPRISSWPTGSRYGGANWFRNTLGHPALNGELISLPPGQGYVGYESDALRMPPNVYYTVSFDAHCYNGAQGVCVDVYGPNVDSAGAVLNLTSTPTHYKFTEILTVPEAPLARLRVFGLGGPGVAEVYNLKVEFGIKDTAWCDNVITRENVSTFIRDAAIGLALIDRASIANLSALVAYLGSVQLGVGGALWTGQEAYDTGVGLRLGTNAADDPYFSLRSASDKYLRIRPKSDVFEASKWTIINPDLQLADRVASITSSPGDAFAHFHSTAGAYCGSHTAGISNPVNPTYAWSISSIAVQASFSLGSTTNAQTTVFVASNGAIAGDEVECMITCSISDGGTTLAVSKIIYVTFT